MDLVDVPKVTASDRTSVVVPAAAAGGCCKGAEDWGSGAEGHRWEAGVCEGEKDHGGIFAVCGMRM